MTAQTKPWLVVEREIVDLLTRVELSAYEGLLRAFDNRRQRWFFSGQGRSGLIAQMMAMRLAQAGYNTHVVGEVTAPSVRAGDGFFLVCGSGQTPVSLSFAAIAKAEGAKLVVVTHKPQSKLASMADVLLPVPMEQSVQFGGSLFEQACLILFDSLILHLTAQDIDAHAAMWRRHTNMQ
jgi:6-phospho-3-hexuloisomerase